MRKAFAILVVLGLLLVGAALWLTAPETARPSAGAASVDAASGDPEQGRVFFLAGGCLGCHQPPEDAPGRDPKLPSGGHPLPSPVGTFHAPNITPDEATGIGAWSFADFVTAMREGTSPGGNHYFPAFPYASYRSMSEQDLAHLYAYLMTLEPVDAPARGHDIIASGLLRPFLGIWKAMALGEPGFTPDPSRSQSWNRGAYLVAGAGHCGECHTPRSLFFVMDQDRYLQGGPHPEGKGSVPNLIGLIPRGEYESAASLKEAFEYGEMFGYGDMSSGGMGEVQGNLSRLPAEDLDAIVEYLVSLE